MGRPRKPIAHGTKAGYLQEIRRGLRTCAACRQAWRAYCLPYNRRYRELHPDRHAWDGTDEAEAKRAARLDGAVPPPTPEQAVEEFLRDS